MLKKFLTIIQKNQLIEKGNKIVVGVSGGPDSICLLHLLWRIRKNFNLNLYSVHLNHQFRGKEAEEDALYVKKICEKLEIPVFVYTKDVAQYSKEKGISFEEGGREIRYRLFGEVMSKKGADKIAIAQNQDDQAETVLMRLIRGSGMEGLSAMDYIREGKIIRPILDISRKEIEYYCDKYQLNPRIDRTNLESVYTRNRIRLEIIPYIERYFNPNIKSTLCRTADLLREDNDFIERIVEEIYSKVVKKSGSNILINVYLLKEHHSAIQKRIFRKAFAEISGNLKNFEQIHIQSLIDLVYSGKVGSEIHLPKKIVVVLEYDYLIFQKRNSKIKNKNFEYPVEIDKKIWLKECNAYLSCNVVKIDKDFQISDGIYKKHFDFNKIQNKLMIRNRRPGDRFYPLGLQGSKKLKDYFIDEKIPQRERDSIPLLCDGDQIMWIIGYRMSEKYKIDKNTKMVLTVYYVPKNIS